MKTHSADWSRSPAALFSTIILGLISVSGLVWSINRAMYDGLQETASLPVAVDTQHPDASINGGLSEVRSSQNQALETRALSPRRLININQARSGELEMLPGIGPALASRIIADREENGSFDTIDALQRVKGIGPKTVEKIRASVTIDSGAAFDIESRSTDTPDQASSAQDG
jgi:comEA protein